MLQTQGCESIAAKLVANLITEAGADRVLACDLHSGQSMGYFDIPMDHVHGQPVILDYLANKAICSDVLVVVSLDVGGVARTRDFAKKLSELNIWYATFCAYNTNGLIYHSDSVGDEFDW
ncbi:ribose-phosphate pyrophosphokinase 1-like [Olea europaea var. sylvestris]|uniref:ribose-phosphate pyrophosphokinase 1-like n=1 Tax=Olea europaea var. sylvestris TaxID=158386 RepID=UPI000C1D8435|nr:ribose-phosphate pyrophosphokinase 1-like [Olea europaea var. sylvestris]